ncbi:MAG TPA: hypothetical protein VFW82_06800, partial [Dyella sp.]|nr:hypothetical protein [Dyella sp.]
TLTGSSVGNTTLTGANQINTLGSFSAANLSLTNAQGLAVNGPLTVPGALSLTTTSGGLSLNTDLSAGAITLDTAADLDLTKNLSATTVSLTSGGAIDQNGGVITAGTLTGSSVGNTTLTGANLIDTLGSFSAANLSLINAQGLAVNGPLTVPGALSLTTTSGGLSLNTDLSAGAITLDTAADLDLTKNLSATNVALTSGGAITQSGGVIIAGTLTGSSTGDTTLTGANLIDALGSFSAANMSLQNAQSLSVTGAVSTVGGTGAIALTTTSGSLGVRHALSGGTIALAAAGDLLLADNIAALDVSLISGGDLAQTGGIIQASTLSGSAAGSATLQQANKVATLGDFAATAGLAFANSQSLRVGGSVDGGSATRLATSAGSLSIDGRVLGDGIQLAGQDGLLINGAVDAGAGELDLSSMGGTITEAASGSVIAGSLSGSSFGDTTLTGANQVATLGNFTSGGNFSLRDLRTLTVNSPLSINAGNGDLALSTVGTGSDLILATDLQGGKVTLVSGRDIKQAGSGLRAVSLTGSAGRDVLLTGSNHVSTLGDFSAASFNLTNAQNLAVGGTVATGSGALQLATTSGALSVTGALEGGAVSLASAGDLALDGGVTADVLALQSGGAIGQGASGVITANSLSGQSIGSTTLEGANRVGALGSFSADGLRFANAVGFSVTGPVDGGSATTLTTTAGDLLLQGEVRGATTTLRSAGAITESGSGIVVADQLTGRASGIATLAGANRVGTLGAFDAAGLNLSNAGTLVIAGPVVVSGTTRLATTTGDLHVDGSIDSSVLRLESAGAISEGNGGVITAGTLSGSAAGITTLGTRAQPIANHVDTLGNFSSPAGFSFTNAQTLTLASVQGSTFTIDAGHAALYLGITGGDLLQSGETPMYDGAGTFFSSGRMGTALAPLYVIGDSAQVIADVGVPPAYFYALDRQGNFLPLTGDLSFNVPTSLFFGKAQNGNGRGDAYIDPSVISANYRSFGIVPSGILLPEDQQQCQPELEDCSDE